VEAINTIPDIERLVKAQNAAPLIESDVALVNGQHFDYRIKSDNFGRTLGELLTPPRPAKLNVSTLTGFLDAIAAETIGYGPTVIHVEDYLTVSVKSTACDVYGVRDTLLTAKHTPIDAFRFDEYYNDPARFIIGLQVAFLQTDELLKLIRIASNLKAGNTVQVEDDGFSQTVTLKAGEVSTAEVKVPPRIKLIPIRTFPEAAPAETEFLIRFKQTPDQTPAIALFNVDGTKWQSDTMLSIKAYLAKNLPEGTPILA
jgi:hypothetical protein